VTPGVPAEAGNVLQDRYRLDEHIAVGGMGEVWQGTDLVLNRKVAVKLLRPEHANDEDLLARFRSEARLAGLLSHPNICQVFDFNDAQPPDPAYLVMEYVDGPSLAGLLHDGPLDSARTMDIVAQAARGLAAAHRAGMIHRDVKPGNLLVRDDGLIKVSDFGIARAESATPVTRTGLLPGTPGYMAPERSAGAGATPSSDLYSLGVVAYQCLTGRPPFEGDALAVAIAHMDRDMPPLPPSVPAPVAALVAELTSKDPQDRPSSAQNVADRAERLKAIQAQAAEGTAMPAVAPTLPDLPRVSGPGAEGFRLLEPRTWRQLRVPAVPSRAALSAAAVVAIAVAGLVGWMLGARPFAPTAGSPRSTHASQPGRGDQAGGQSPSPGTGVTATPDVKPSSQPSSPAPTASPSSSPSPTPSPSASASPSSSPSPSAAPSASVSPTPAAGT
jgi:eukaryotic-like serine/threonine-protein kinase